MGDSKDGTGYNMTSSEFVYLTNFISCMKGDMENMHTMYAGRENPEIGLCNATFDRALCWPTSLPDTMVKLPCPLEFEGHHILPGGHAFKYCYDNGTWNTKANYSDCPFVDGTIEAYHTLAQNIIYLTGFAISTIALVVALFIFLYFRALRCLRNTIHCHLIVTFILKNLMWIILYVVLPTIHGKDSLTYQWVCKMSITLFQYLHVTNFFWMLVEGIYLLFMVVWVFSNQTIKMWYLIIIGWCLPLIVIVTWAAVKYVFENDKDLCWLNEHSNYAWIHIAPVLLVLLINTIILIAIVYILVTKLRATNCAHTRQSKKAIKATLILFPLLGLTYVLFISPYSNNHVERKFFTYFNAVLQSLQGLEVAVFYCFLNGEVKSVVKGKFSQWQDERSVATRYTRASVVSTMETAPAAIKCLQENGNTGPTKVLITSPDINEKEIPLTSAVDGQYGDEML